MLDFANDAHQRPSHVAGTKTSSRFSLKCAPMLVLNVFHGIEYKIA